MATITRVIRVVDTRKWISGPSGAFPIPGSGTLNDCKRCGASHEIHAHVLLSDGTVAVMGETCATREAPHLGDAVKDAVSLARALARAQAKLAALEKLAEEWRVYLRAIAAERGLRSPEDIPDGVFYELRHATAAHFAAKGMSDWYRPPTRAQFATAQKAVKRLLERVESHRA